MILQWTSYIGEPQQSLLNFNNTLYGNISQNYWHHNSKFSYKNEFIGLLLALLISINLKSINARILKLNKKKFSWYIQPKNIYALLSIIVFLLIAPVCSITFLICYTYRMLVRTILKLKLKENFVDLMDGTDSIWAIEDETAYSIITGLGIIETPESVSSSELYDKLKTRIYERLFAPPIPYPKMFYSRKFSMGYFYWEHPQNYTVEDFVRSISIPSKNQSYITKDELESYIATITNSQLHKEHSTSWEILIVNQPLEHANKTVKHYPVIFRVHHTLGDGFALVQLLLQTMANKNIEMHNVENIRPASNPKSYRRMQSLTYVANGQRTYNSFWKVILKNFKKVNQYAFIPSLIFSHLFRKPDENALHGNELSGEKTLTWISSDNNQKLFHKIKKIKQRIPDTRFSDIIISAISFGISEYFKKNGYEIPATITNVIPARAEIRNEDGKSELMQLNNRFTVGMLTIPLCPNSNCIDRLKHVQHYTNQLRNSMEFAVNYWIMKVLSTVLPARIFGILIYSKHSTSVVSNIPGPHKIYLFDEMIMDDLIFWIPNRGKTGVGFSVLTYDNRLQLGILCDKQFITNSEHAQSILQEIVKEIENLATVTDITM